jgi:hypothetical protein
MSALILGYAPLFEGNLRVIELAPLFEDIQLLSTTVACMERSFARSAGSTMIVDRNSILERRVG